jgi:hypothetical protein
MGGPLRSFALRWPYLAGHKKARKLLYLRALKNGGQTQNRTGDTRIFSPLLYRLSYLASFEKGGIKCGLAGRVN